MVLRAFEFSITSKGLQQKSQFTLYIGLKVFFRLYFLLHFNKFETHILSHTHICPNMHQMIMQYPCTAVWFKVTLATSGKGFWRVCKGRTNENEHPESFFSRWVKETPCWVSCPACFEIASCNFQKNKPTPLPLFLSKEGSCWLKVLRWCFEASDLQVSLWIQIKPLTYFLHPKTTIMEMFIVATTTNFYNI